MNDKGFGYLGHQFQISLLNLLITDKKFSQSILHAIDPKYFENQYFRLLVQMIKEFNHKYENVIPSFEVIQQLTVTEIEAEQPKKYVFDILEEVRNANVVETGYYKEKALKFCKQQELAKAIKKVEKIISKGDFEHYDEAEELIKKALQIGSEDGGYEDIFENLDEALSPDFRHPIPMGVSGIDNVLGGGLGKGEVGVILAPTGVGKSTLLTKIANTAYQLGYNVLHIFFEDNKGQIRKKHLTCFTGIAPDELDKNRAEVDTVVKQITENNKGRLILKRIPSDTLTFTEIKAQIRKIISEGIKLDMVVIDYIDCVVNPSGDWTGEGTIMRQFDGMCTEFDLVGWTGTQGSRGSISQDVVTTDQMGGSIKKAQIGHVIITVAKSLQQKEAGLANMAIVKSRIGPDGIVFNNCKFDNKMLIIDTESSDTLLGFENEKERQESERKEKKMNEVLKRIERKRDAATNNNQTNELTN